MKFSKLIRLNLEHTRNIVRPLKDEVQVVASFLEINKLRFKESLDYSLIVQDKHILIHQVPKMVLQIHVENAIKHGLSRKKGKGMVLVSVKQEGSLLHLVVEDNGIGREKALLVNRPSTRQGLKMLNAIYERLNRQNREKIKQQYTALTDENGNPAGTRVEIWVPLNLKE
jgi:LytS/YehU family sensor histidine kinase